MNLSETEVTILLSTSQSRITCAWKDQGLVVQHSVPGSGPHRIPHHRVLRIRFDSATRTLSVAYLTEKSSKKVSSLVQLQGIVEHSENNIVEQWVDATMRAIYDDVGVQRSRRLMVLVNPHGGIKRGSKVYTKVVEPIFRSAGCSLTVLHTNSQGHAFEVAKTLPMEYDAIVTVSGDGLIHEVMNGLAQHAEPLNALSIPVAPIPTGSGNGLALNLLGIEDGFDVISAALNVIKGKHMKIDLFSVTQNGKRTMSFMSQALGLMADLDIGTEHLRWMGDARFMYGLLRGIMQLKPCPVQLSLKVAEKDKDTMAERFHTRINGNNSLTSTETKKGSVYNALPSLKHLPDDIDGWITIDEPLLYVYAGQGPYVGRDYMAFPVSLPDDGLIDVMAMPLSSRKNLLGAMSGAPTGENFWDPKLHYMKAHAYRVKPLKQSGNLAVDGEIFPFEEFQVEVHPGLATLLSCHGRYATEFKPRPVKS